VVRGRVVSRKMVKYGFIGIGIMGRGMAGGTRGPRARTPRAGTAWPGRAAKHRPVSTLQDHALRGVENEFGSWVSQRREARWFGNRFTTKIDVTSLSLGLGGRA